MSENTHTTGLSIQAFYFEECPVRTLIRNEEPWFVAADVCRVLGIRNSRDAVARLDADEKNTVALTDGNRGGPNVTIINESGLYTLILRCDDAIKAGTTAHRFRQWVTSEVLPALRRQWAYSLAQQAEEEQEAARLLDVKAYVARGIRHLSDVMDMTIQRGAIGG